jgi:PA14 domain
MQRDRGFVFRAVLLAGLAGLAGLTACSFSSTLLGDDEPGQPRTLIDAELTGVARDGVVGGGNVTPDGFVLGGLHARGFQAQLVDNGEDMAKILLDAAASTQLGAGYAQVPIDWGNGRPKGLGLTNDSSFTVIYDGEILLPKGEVTLEASVDDRAVIELMGTRLANTGTVSFVVDEGGWYPIKAAVTQASGMKRLVMTIVQGQVRTTVDGSRLRARVTSEPGLVGFVFDDEHFTNLRGQIARPTVDEVFAAAAPPYDLTTSFDHFSLRFAGQLRIDTAGTYTFDAAISTDDSARLWIDGTPVAHTRWPGLADVPTGTVDLTAGWHTILVDYMDEIGLANIEVHMTGPDAPGGGKIDPMHLRPVVAFGNTYTSTPEAPKDVGDNTSTFVPLVLPGSADEVIDAVDYAFQIDNQNMTTLEVTLFDCNQAGRLLTTGLLPGVYSYAADKSCAGQVTNPIVDWSLRLFDTAAGTTPFVGPGVVRDFWISALYHGGPKMPFAPVFSYTSTPQATPGARRIQEVRVLGELAGATVEVAVRAADDPAGLDAQSFELVREGVKIEAAGEYVQYRVTISTNGWISPVLDKVEIDYVAR